MAFCEAQGKISATGWTKEFLKRDAKGITGQLDVIFSEAGKDVFGKEQVIHQEDGYWSTWWAGEIRGNWMEGLVNLAFVSENKILRAKAEKIISELLASQGEDGYIGIYQPGHRYIVTNRFGELWTQSRAMRTLLCYYRFTGDEQVLAALIRMADNICENVKGSVFEKPDEDGSKGHSLMIIDGLYELYKLTGDSKYRDFCIWLYGDFCDHPSKFYQDDMRLCNVMDPEKPLVGHGPHTCESLRLPLLLFDMTGDKKYLSAYSAGLAKLSQNLCLSGSCKSDEFIGTYQSELVMETSERTTVASGSLPLPSTGYEYCSTVELMFDYLKAELLSGDLSYADRLEWLVYNAGFASKYSDHHMIQYLGADNMYDASACVNPRFDYSPTHVDAAGCCAANSGRMMPAFLERAFLTKGETVFANLYLPCKKTVKVRRGSLTIEEKTEYPFGNEIRFSVSGNGSVRLAFRIPAWAQAYSLTKNGSSCAGRLEDHLFVPVEETKGGDELVLTFFAPVELLTAPDGTKAVRAGTILYSYDIPAKRINRHKYKGAPHFYDADFVPQEHENWDYTLFVGRDGKLLSYAFVNPEEGGYPLEGHCPKLSVKALNRYAYPVDLLLSPIAATTLRRTSFPVLYDRGQVYEKGL